MPEIEVVRRRRARRRSRGAAWVTGAALATVLGVASTVVGGTLDRDGDDPPPVTALAPGRTPSVLTDLTGPLSSTGPVMTTGADGGVLAGVGPVGSAVSAPPGAGADTAELDGSPQLDDVPGGVPDPGPVATPPGLPPAAKSPPGPLTRLVGPVLDDASAVLPVVDVVRPPVDLLTACLDATLTALLPPSTPCAQPVHGH